MKFDLAKEELALILSDLNEQFEMMNEHKNEIPQIEMDIFMRNIQKLYENSIKLKKANSQTDFSLANNEIEYQEEKQTAKIVDAVQERLAEIKRDSQKMDDQEEMTTQSEIEVRQESREPKDVERIAEVKEDVSNVVEKVRFEKPPHIESSFDDILEDTTPEVNLFSEIKVNKEITDLNKKLAEARSTHSIVEKLQSGRIESLKSVIGINDKFYFINELFGGNAQKYEDVIYTLNNFKKFDDAMQYFSTLKYRFTWEEDSEAYMKLVNMLERKFNFSHA